jgi:hypothetical protein
MGTQVDSIPIATDDDRYGEYRFDTMKSYGSKVRLSDCADQFTIEKIKSFTPPDLRKFASNATLIERVTSGPIGEAPKNAEGQLEELKIEHINTVEQLIEGEPPKTIAEQLAEIEPEHFAAVERSIEEGLDLDQNFMIKVQVLVAQILAQLNRIAENDREKIEKLKTKYRNTTLEAANFQRDLGKNGFKFAAIAFGASFLRFLGNADDRAIAEVFAGQVCKGVGEMFGASIQANLSQAQALSSLLLQEYQAKTNNASSDAQKKTDFTNMLEKALRLLEAAARNG